MKLNLLLPLLAVHVGVLCGCSEGQVPVSELAVQNARRSIHALSPNASVKVIKESYSVRTNIVFVADKEMRLSLIRAWEKRLRDIPVDGLSPETRYCVVRESSDMLNSYVSAALWDAGCDMGEIWELHFRTLEWLDRQVALMKPEDSLCKGLSRRDLLAKWNFYQALAEWRETIVENHERFDLDIRTKILGEERINEIRQRFQHMIGRPVRSCTEIKMLGHYHKLVRKRIEAEKKAALAHGGRQRRQQSPNLRLESE